MLRPVARASGCPTVPYTIIHAYTLVYCSALLFNAFLYRGTGQIKSGGDVSNFRLFRGTAGSIEAAARLFEGQYCPSRGLAVVLGCRTVCVLTRILQRDYSECVFIPLTGIPTAGQYRRFSVISSYKHLDRAAVGLFGARY